jgi:hypothetical protein
MKKTKAHKPSPEVKTANREKIAIWLDHEALAILRKWRDEESLSIANFVRASIMQAIKRKQAVRAIQTPATPQAVSPVVEKPVEQMTQDEFFDIPPASGVTPVVPPVTYAQRAKIARGKTKSKKV